MAWLPDSEKRLKIRLVVLIEYQCVIDKRTDILRRHTPRCAKHCAVKTKLTIKTKG